MYLWLRSHASDLIFFIVLTELLIAVFLDFKFAKFPNKLFLIYAGLNTLLMLVLRGTGSLTVMAITIFVAVMLMIPIYLIRALGGGDIKLILAISPLLLLDEFLGFLCLSFLWAGVFGLIKTTLSGKLKKLILNTSFIAKKVTVAEEGIPFTVGILLGWCSYKSVLAMGVW